MNYILHHFRWTLRRRYREIIGLWLLWSGLLFLPQRTEHAEDAIMAKGLLLICVIALLGVLLDTLIDAPAMGTKQFWRTRPVTWGKLLVTQLLLALVLLLPAVFVWGWQCWRLGAPSDFLLGTLAIFVLGLAGAAIIAAAASFAKGRAQFVWVVPLAVGLGYVWWVALLDHGLVALPLGLIVFWCVVAPGMQRGKWRLRAGLGLLVVAGVYFVRKQENWDRTHELYVQLAKLSQRTAEKAELSLRDDQQHLRATLPPSADYIAPTGDVVPVAEGISVVLPLPADIPAINRQLNLPAETRWYESAFVSIKSKLRSMRARGPSVRKILARERSPLVLGKTARDGGELTTHSSIRNDSERLVISYERWRVVWENSTDTQYFLYSAARSLVLPGREDTEKSDWLPVWMGRSNTTLTISLPPGELLSGGPWRDDELSGLEIITVKSRPCLPPLPLEQTPTARAEQLHQLAQAIERFGCFLDPEDYLTSYDPDDLPSFGEAYGKAGMDVLMQGSSVPDLEAYDRARFRGYSNEALVAQATRNVGWFVNIARWREELPLGAAARGLLKSGANPDVGLLAHALQGATESDHPLILQTLANLPQLKSNLLYGREPWRELVKLPQLKYQPAMRALWKRFGRSSPSQNFTFAAALSGELEAMDDMVLNASSHLSSYEDDQIRRQSRSEPVRTDPWKPGYDLQNLVPQAPHDWMEFFKWYAEHRSALAWDAATGTYLSANGHE